MGRENLWCVYTFWLQSPEHQKAEALGDPDRELERRAPPPPTVSDQSSPFCRFTITLLAGAAENFHSRREVVADSTALLLQDKPRETEEWSSRGAGLVYTGCSWAQRCQDGTLGPATVRVVQSEDSLPGLECQALDFRGCLDHTDVILIRGFSKE